MCVRDVCVGDMHGRGVCMAGVCMGGHALYGGHAWQGSVHGGGEACTAGEMATAADGMHPTGMHSCSTNYVSF